MLLQATVAAKGLRTSYMVRWPWRLPLRSTEQVVIVAPPATPYRLQPLAQLPPALTAVMQAKRPPEESLPMLGGPGWVVLAEESLPVLLRLLTIQEGRLLSWPCCWHRTWGKPQPLRAHWPRTF